MNRNTNIKSLFCLEKFNILRIIVLINEKKIIILYYYKIILMVNAVVFKILSNIFYLSYF